MRLAWLAALTTFLTPLSAHALDPGGLLPFASEESIARLDRAKAKADFFRLANQFESQINKAFCGPASSTIVLNALRISNDKIAKPKDPSLFPAEYRKGLPPGMDPLFARYSQSTFFDAKTEAVKPLEEFFGKPKTPGAKFNGGLQLRELAGILKTKGLDVQIRVANESLTDAAIIKELSENLRTSGDYVIVNYFRPALGQQGGGHLSPLGAYDAESSSFLILDVNATAQIWVWAPAALLIKAMRTMDAVENRGYLLIKEGS